MRTLFASKKCPHCGEWSAWQQQDDDRCTHCGELLDVRAEERAAEEAARQATPTPQLLLIEIKPTDGPLLRGVKYLIRGGQLAFAGFVAFIIWLITLLAG